MVEFDKKMAENKKEVTFKDTSLREIYKDNESVISVLNRLDECMLCARGSETTSEDQNVLQKVEELVESVKRTLVVMNSLITDTPTMRVEGQIQMYTMLSVGLHRDLKKMFGIVLTFAKYLDGGKKNVDTPRSN